VFDVLFSYVFVVSIYVSVMSMLIINYVYMYYI
jgi:hypothetical protein